VAASERKRTLHILVDGAGVVIPPLSA